MNGRWSIYGWTQADRDYAAAWWRSMRRSSIKLAHLGRKRFLDKGMTMADILLLSKRK